MVVTRGRDGGSYFLHPGPFPTWEPQVRAPARFITGHRNITGAVAFHTYSCVLLRPYSHMADDSLPVEDVWTYQKIGARGAEITGYPNISVFHELRYHPEEVITGSMDDWAYDQLGVFAWTVEIWSPQRQAGIGEIELPAGASLETGRTRQELGQLEGRAYKPASPSGWGGWSGDTTEDRAKFEWVVRADAGAVVVPTAVHERAGRVRTSLTLAA